MDDEMNERVRVSIIFFVFGQLPVNDHNTIGRL